MVCTQHSGTSKPRSLLIFSSVGLKRMCRASLISSTEFLGASSKIQTSLQFIVCPSCQACSATADFSSCPAARCSFILVSRVLLVSPIYMHLSTAAWYFVHNSRFLLRRDGILHSGKGSSESAGRLECCLCLHCFCN